PHPVRGPISKIASERRMSPRYPSSAPANRCRIRLQRPKQPSYRPPLPAASMPGLTARPDRKRVRDERPQSIHGNRPGKSSLAGALRRLYRHGMRFFVTVLVPRRVPVENLEVTVVELMAPYDFDSDAGDERRSRATRHTRTSAPTRCSLRTENGSPAAFACGRATTSSRPASSSDCHGTESAGPLVLSVTADLD